MVVVVPSSPDITLHMSEVLMVIVHLMKKLLKESLRKQMNMSRCQISSVQNFNVLSVPDQSVEQILNMKEWLRSLWVTEDDVNSNIIPDM